MADFNFTTPVVSLSTSSDATSEARKAKYDSIGESTFFENVGKAARVGVYVGVGVGVATLLVGGARCLSSSIFGSED